MRRVEGWLDRGMGECILKSTELSSVVVEKLMKDESRHHELGCYVVMPNHVHAVVRPVQPESVPLETILQQWKGGSARDINQRLGSSGTIWQRESFDRIIRDVEHLYRVIQYIGRNPANAGMTASACRLWIRPSWVEHGWHFEAGSPPAA